MGTGNGNNNSVEKQQPQQQKPQQQKKTTSASTKADNKLSVSESNSRPAGWATVPNKVSLLQIQQEEEQRRRMEELRLYEEHMRQQQNAPRPFAWNIKSPNENLSLEQIQQNQLEEARRQQEQARIQARQRAEAQQTAMWANTQSSRPRSLLEIQQEELRQKQLRQQQQQQQQQRGSASVNLMWGPTWNTPASFNQLQ